MTKLKQLALAAGFVLMTGATAFAQDAVQGKKIFEGNCAACHSMDADVVGPALKDVHERRGDEWLHKFIKNSQEMIQAGDADAVAVYEKFNKMPMPAFGGSLTDDDINHVIAYIKEASAAAPAVAEAPAATTTAEAAAPAAVQEVAFMDLPPIVHFIYGLVGLIILLIIIVLIMLFRLIVPMMGDSLKDEEFQGTFSGRVYALLSGDATVMTGKAKDVIHSTHDFDGIQEYDNDLPPWWKYMFYVTIVFAVGYMLHYHVFRTGALQIEEYETEMAQAALIAAQNVEDPNAVTDFEVLTDAGALESGKALYIQNCAACHGQAGEGTVGPNLTDEYWIHGGDVNDIFRTIKFGVPSKGMVPWQGKLTKDQMLEVSSYILSLQGTNPPNAKEAQGEKE
ncbi:c-type cytochrome [Pontibacter virosus]|uniref:Cytochrome c oxidase cbb3-type subunit 3 n=1 Tax=Pontibacter virosus TaxID=1765052 RepID=A0A2U1AQX8_9BACT|nr:c-type cytochrome [Pontibacter virosus]PVY38737.1 cytochrome c oxidase cbb3-type subunit 3 [Pontibacter virosus]